MTAQFAQPGTLAANTVTNVPLANNPTPGVTVLNRTGTAEMWATVAEGTSNPTPPTVAGADSFCIPAAICSYTIPVPPGACVVTLISAAGSAPQNYAVQAGS